MVDHLHLRGGAPQRLRVSQIAGKKLRIRPQRTLRRRAPEHADRMAMGQEPRYQVGPEKSRPSGDEDSHVTASCGPPRDRRRRLRREGAAAGPRPEMGAWSSPAAAISWALGAEVPR